MATFNITKPSRSETWTGIYASAASRGLALAPSTSASDTFIAADVNTGFIGFLQRDVTVAGPLILDSILPDRTPLNMPFVAGDYVTVERGDEVEAGGSAYIDSSITSSSAVGIAVTFTAGKFAAATGTNDVLYKLSAKLGNDADGDYVYRFTIASA